MNRIIITGIGLITPIGVGKEQFWQNVISGASGVGKTNRFPSLPELLCGEISDTDAVEDLSDRRLRRSANISKYAFAAANLAINDAWDKPADNINTALIFGITHGALNYTQAFHSALLREGVDAASPLFFSDSVLNAPASNTSICLGLGGSVHTLVDGSAAALKAIMLARRLLDGGSADRVLIVCAEELNELSLSCYLQKGISPLSEGSGALLIERETTEGSPTRGNDNKISYCRISGTASIFNPSYPAAALTDALTQCLEKADMDAENIDLIVAGRDMQAGPPFKGVSTVSITHLTGDAFAATALWHVILGSLIIKNGKIPEAVITNKASMPDQVRNVLVYTNDGQGIASAVSLSI
ncbi:MAG: beta-ketoacyl synthase chain length factor [Nitrospirae bacterium]|nr:beta-ketoacyl synthase chain length factor [Nitrospirota bacterium]